MGQDISSIRSCPICWWLHLSLVSTLGAHSSFHASPWAHLTTSSHSLCDDDNFRWDPVLPWPWISLRASRYTVLVSSAQENTSAMVSSTWRPAGLVDQAGFASLLKMNKQRSVAFSAMMFMKRCWPYERLQLHFLKDVRCHVWIHSAFLLKWVHTWPVPIQRANAHGHCTSSIQ